MFLKSLLTRLFIAQNLYFSQLTHGTVALGLEKEKFGRITAPYERVLSYAYVETPLCALNLGFFLEFGQLQNFQNTLVCFIFTFSVLG